MSFGIHRCERCGRDGYALIPGEPTPLEVCFAHGLNQWLCKRCYCGACTREEQIQWLEGKAA